MKRISVIPLIHLLLLFGGCTLHELSVNQHGKQLAPTLGVDETDIQIVSRCEYGIVNNPSSEGYRARKATLAVTDSDLFFMTRHKRYLFSKDVSTLPVNELEGVALLNSQIQLQFRGQTMVLQLSDVPSPQRTQEKCEELYRSFLALGVPSYEATVSYVRTGYVYSGLTNLQQNGANASRRFNSNPNRHLGSPYSGRRYVPPR